MRRKKFIENFCNFNTIIDLHRTFQENLYEDLVHCCRQNITIVRSNLNLIHIQNILEYIDFNRLKRCAATAARSRPGWKPSAWKTPAVAESPGPPNQPKSFWVPWAAIERPT